MAKLKFGSGIKIEAQLPKFEEMYEEEMSEVSEESEAPSIDIEKLKKELLDSMPKYEYPKYEHKEVDLSPLHAKHDSLEKSMNSSIENLHQKHNEIENRIHNLNSMIEKNKSERLAPEIKSITNIKDVSQDVLQECKEFTNRAELNIMLKMSDLQIQNKRQKMINYILGSALILTIFLHLL